MECYQRARKLDIQFSYFTGTECPTTHKPQADGTVSLPSASTTYGLAKESLLLDTWDGKLGFGFVFVTCFSVSEAAHKSKIKQDSQQN